MLSSKIEGDEVTLTLLAIRHMWVVGLDDAPLEDEGTSLSRFGQSFARCPYS